MIPERPMENSYWVVPGKFLAGEYPGSRDDSATETKLKALVDAGITSFVDLTQAGEGLAPYHHKLVCLQGSDVSALRFSIPDMSVPTPVSATRAGSRRGSRHAAWLPIGRCAICPWTAQRRVKGWASDSRTSAAL